jgi:hypothetical protein
MKKSELRQIIKEELLKEAKNPHVKTVQKMFSDMEDLHYELAHEYSGGDGDLEDMTSGKVLKVWIDRILNDLEHMEAHLKRLK